MVRRRVHIREFWTDGERILQLHIVGDVGTVIRDRHGERDRVADVRRGIAHRLHDRQIGRVGCDRGLARGVVVVQLSKRRRASARPLVGIWIIRRDRTRIARQARPFAVGCVDDLLPGGQRPDECARDGDRHGVALRHLEGRRRGERVAGDSEIGQAGVASRIDHRCDGHARDCGRNRIVERGVVGIGACQAVVGDRDRVGDRVADVATETPDHLRLLHEQLRFDDGDGTALGRGRGILTAVPRGVRLVDEARAAHVGIHVEHDRFDRERDRLVGGAVSVGIDDIAQIVGESVGAAAKRGDIVEPRHGQVRRGIVHRRRADIRHARRKRVDEFRRRRPPLWDRHRDGVGGRLADHRLRSGVVGIDDRRRDKRLHDRGLRNGHGGRIRGLVVVALAERRRARSCPLIGVGIVRRDLARIETGQARPGLVHPVHDRLAGDHVRVERGLKRQRTRRALRQCVIRGRQRTAAGKARRHNARRVRERPGDVGHPRGDHVGEIDVVGIGLALPGVRHKNRERDRVARLRRRLVDRLLDLELRLDHGHGG